MNVTVLGVNDNAPRFDKGYNPVVSRSMRVGQTLKDGELQIIDADGDRDLIAEPQCDGTATNSACDLFDFDYRPGKFILFYIQVI